MNIHELDSVEKASIREFVQRAADDGWLRGRVLDYGCGQQPYRPIVEAVAEYFPLDRKAWGGNVSRADIGNGYGLRDGHGAPWDSILSTQVLQYVDDPAWWLDEVHEGLHVGGALVLTYPTHWPELRDDLHRFTRLGMERLLAKANFEIVLHEPRAFIQVGDLALAYGYGVVAIT